MEMTTATMELSWSNILSFQKPTPEGQESSPFLLQNIHFFYEIGFHSDRRGLRALNMNADVGEMQ